MFHYKVLYNTLYVNKTFFKFEKVISPRCSFCKLWHQLKSINNLNFPISTPQSAIFRFWNLDTNEHLILNHLLLIFKMYIYIARTTGYLNISHLLIYIKETKDTKKKLCENDATRRKKLIRIGKVS